MSRRSTVTTRLFSFLFAAVALLVFAAPGAAQQESQKGINTSRSNIKNTFRIDPRIDTVQVELAARSGGGARKIPTKNGEFDLGVLPAGEYELRFWLGDKVDSGKAAPDSAKQKEELPYDARLTVEMTGAVGGPIKESLQGQLNSTSRTYGPGKSHFGNVVFKSEGKTKVTGTLRHEAAANGIQNTR